MTTAGELTNTYALNVGSLPYWNTLGPDGNIWFSEGGLADTVGKIDPAGVVTTYPLPVGAEPGGITHGPDGNVWFTEASGQIAKITPAGVITTCILGSGAHYPYGIA